jgi:hypothetical protein
MSKFKLETDLTKYLMLTKIYNMPINALLHERHFLLMLCEVFALEDQCLHELSGLLINQNDAEEASVLAEEDLIVHHGDVSVHQNPLSGQDLV